jgi:hypothetical protein
VLQADAPTFSILGLTLTTSAAAMSAALTADTRSSALDSSALSPPQLYILSSVVLRI